MIAEENILAQIEVLLASGSLPRSACSRGLLRVLKPLLDAGVIVENRSGAGRRIEVVNFEALRSFKRLQYPETTLPEGLSTRVAGVARFRESKSFKNDTPEIVTLRAWTEGSLLKNGIATEAVALTKKHGVFSFLANRSDVYALNGVCALVENPAVFTQFEKLGLPVDLVILGHGKISNRLLEWFSGMSGNFTLLHFPDYDPVGLMEFERLRKVLGMRVRLYIPDDIDSRFKRFSNHALLKADNNRSMLANLRRTTLPETRQILALIDHHNAVLEQESLLLPLPLH